MLGSLVFTGENGILKDEIFLGKKQKVIKKVIKVDYLGQKSKERQLDGAFQNISNTYLNHVRTLSCNVLFLCQNLGKGRELHVIR